MIDKQFDSFVEIMSHIEVKTKSEKDWQFFSYDIPEQCKFGYMLSKTENEQEVSEYLYWAPLGSAVTNDVKECGTIAEFRTALDTMRFRGVFKCDAPKERKIGFVSYDVENKHAHVVRISLTKLRDLDKVDPQFALEMKLRIHM